MCYYAARLANNCCHHLAFITKFKAAAVLNQILDATRLTEMAELFTCMARLN